MSSLLNSLDMSLDDLIKKKKTVNQNDRKNTNNRGSGGGPIRRKTQQTKARQNSTPYSRRGNNNSGDMDVDDDDARPRRGGGNRNNARKASILSRVGGKEDSNLTKIFVTNLKFDILEDDVKELFTIVGQVNKTEILYDRSGRSKGCARVWFTEKVDAEKAINQFDGRTLDGQPMKISLDDGNSRRNVNNNNNDSNVRKGVFGTALNDNDDDDDTTNFSVTFKNKRNDRRGNRGGRGGGRNKNQGGRSSVSADQLDSEMDSYMRDS